MNSPHKTKNKKKKSENDLPEEDFLYYVDLKDEEEALSTLELRKSCFDEDDLRVEKFW